MKNQFLLLFFRLCYFLFLIPNLLFFCHLLHFHYSFSFCFFSSFLSSVFFPLVFLSFLLFVLFLSVFTTLVFSASVSTAFHISLDILLSWLLLFSSQFQDYNILAIVFPKSCSTSVHQLHQSPFFLYVSNNIYFHYIFFLLKKLSTFLTYIGFFYFLQLKPLLSCKLWIYYQFYHTTIVRAKNNGIYLLLFYFISHFIFFYFLFLLFFISKLRVRVMHNVMVILSCISHSHTITCHHKKA